MSNSKSFSDLLRGANEMGASDVHLKAGSPVRLRISGRLTPFGQDLTQQDTQSVAKHILESTGRKLPTEPDELAQVLRETDCAYYLSGVGRYRVNISQQRGSAMVVLRVISNQIPTIQQLGLPKIVADIALEERGLVLVTGATGSGKSTTLAAMISQINNSRPCKIITIEDPIEFLYNDNVASIAQREVGNDTERFANAMRAALRQDPDVILVGEMRDKETVDIALKAAETGHLVLSTVHTPDAPKTITRLVSFGDVAEQAMLRIRLSDCLKAVISQRLLPRADGKGRIPALEVMRTTATIRDCIANPEKTGSIIDHLKDGRDQYGMQSFDQHLMELLESKALSLEVAKAAASNPGDFERALMYV